MTDFSRTRDMFDLPKGVIYLDGNSLGPLPRAATDRMAHRLQNEWGQMLITGWNKAGWFIEPRKVGDRVGKLIGAPAGSVVMGDTLSIKVHQALASALALRPDRRVILSDSGNFPSDLYMAQGIIDTLNQDHRLETPNPTDVLDRIDTDVAVVMVTEVDYRSGRRHDMAAIVERAHQKGALVIWDLAHSAGAVPVDVTAIPADFAVGCTYKFLNGGPGAPAFIYVRPDLAENCRPALSGWMGHESPFAFDLDYRAGSGIDRMRCGTPPVLALAALDAALDVWDDVDMNDLRARSIELSQQFIDGVLARCPDLTLYSPSDPHQRGSQVSFAFQHGYAAIQALIDRGVIGDFRAPNIMRFGITPLYINDTDIAAAIDIIADVMNAHAWDDPKYQNRAAVT
ncbi:kynureninase [Marivivens niveibacter]|uniref:Kynureninase n=1 Tax=Marivivens niveibacter TaxID=1930667 RepID=A0A251WWT1_9RHOB|nr:kynureninase [Marivivens niveibacter]OUD08731.1 kynureninase [Marivivens niveibacter]